MKYTRDQLVKFIKESNAIEKEYSEQAIIDSIQAMDWLEQIETLTLMDILVVHKGIMGNIEPEIAGKLRGELGIDVSVGGRGCPKFWQVGSRLCDWIRHINKKDNPKWTEEDIKRFHISFEHIHPFVDGNGRVGRLIYCWMRQKMELPIHIILESEKQDYYKWFRRLDRL